MAVPVTSTLGNVAGWLGAALAAVRSAAETSVAAGALISMRIITRELTSNNANTNHSYLHYSIAQIGIQYSRIGPRGWSGRKSLLTNCIAAYTGLSQFRPSILPPTTGSQTP